MKKTFVGGIPFKRKNAEYRELGEGLADSIFLYAEDSRTLNVKEGDAVKTGSAIFNMAEDSPAVFSGINGVVEKIETKDGRITVTVKGSEDDSEAEILDPIDKTLGELSAEELSELLLKAGIRPPKEGTKAAKFLTVDCGGSLSDISRLFLCINYPKQVLGGAKILMKILGARKCSFAIPTSCLDAAQSIEDCLPSRKSVIKVALFKEKYPSTPALTVCAITGIEIGAYRLPENVGYPVVTPNLCYAVYQALAEGEPFASGFVSFTDEDEFTSVYKVPFGAKLEEFFSVPEGYKLVSAEKIFGEAVNDGVMPPEVVALAMVEDKPYPIITERGCIGCRRCVDICPGRLLPYQIYNAAEKGKLTSSLKNELMSCFECGCCSAVCPSCLPIYELLSKSRNEYLSELSESKQINSETVEEKTTDEEVIESPVKEPEEAAEESVKEPEEAEEIEKIEEVEAVEDVEESDEAEDDDGINTDGEEKETVEKITITFDDFAEEEPEEITLEITGEASLDEEPVIITGEITSDNTSSKKSSKRKKKKNKKENNDAPPQDDSGTEKADLNGIFGEDAGGEN